MGRTACGFLVQPVPGTRVRHDFVPAGVQEAVHLEASNLRRDCVVQVPETQGADPIEDKWCDGVWVGRVTLSDEHVVLTPRGVERTRSVKRNSESEQFPLKMLNDGAGLHWNPNAKTLVARCQLGSAQGPVGIGDLVPQIPGTTRGCAGCHIPGWHHTLKCVKRRKEVEMEKAAKRRRGDDGDEPIGSTNAGGAGRSPTSSRARGTTSRRTGGKVHMH